MALTKVGPAGIGSTPGTGYTIGDSFLHSTGLNATNAYFTGIVTSQNIRVLGDLQVDGTTTTLDTVVTSVDRLEVAANNATVGVAITQNSSGDILNLYDGSTEVFSVADGGRVGIKNATGVADFDLDVGGEIASKNANKEFIGIKLVSNEARIRSSFYSGASGAYRPITFYTSDAERLRITSGGDVGINSTAPTKKLDVQGHAVFGPSATRLHTYSDSGYSGIYNGSSLTSDESFYMGGGSLFFYADGGEVIRVLANGNVGIATANPNDHNSFSRALDVNGPSGAALYLRTNGSTTNCFIVGNYGTEAYFNNRAAGNIRFFTDGVEKLRLTNAGLVGIGTDTPGAGLHVLSSSYPTATIQRDHAVNYPRLRLINNSNNGGDVDGIGDGSPAGGLRFATITGGTSTVRMMIDGDGHVGINQGAPSRELDVVGQLIVKHGSSGMLFQESNNGAFLWLDGANGDFSGGDYFHIAANNNSQMTFGYAGAEQIFINNTGRLGIAAAPYTGWESSSNSSVLQIKNAVLWDYAGAQFDMGNNYYYDGTDYHREVAGYAARMSFAKSTGNTSFSSGGNGNAGDSFTWTERMRISAGGSVMINTDAGLSDLQVCTPGSNKQDGTFRIGGSGAALGLVLDYDQNGATVSRITANPEYTNVNSLLKICVDGDANADQLVLTGAGKIGVNEDAPTAQLHVNYTGTQTTSSFQTASHIRLDGTSGADALSGIGFGYSNSGAHYPSAWMGIQVSSWTAYVKHDLVFATRSVDTNSEPTESLRINANGNVTIGGKSNPNWASTVDALTIGYAGVLYEDSYTSGTDNYLILGNNQLYDASSGANTYIRNDEASRIMMQSGNWWFQNAAAGTAGNAISYTTRFRINSDGKVGINLNAPTRELDVYTSSNSSSTIRIQAVGTTTYAQIEWLHDSDASTWIWKQGSAQSAYAGNHSWNFYNPHNSPIAFYTNTTSRMQIDGAGDVIIASTASPTSRAKLDVRMRSDHPGFNITHNDGSFYRQLGSVGPYDTAGNGTGSGQYLHVRLRTTWNDEGMTMFRITGYYSYSVYAEAYAGCYRYNSASYRNSPYGQLISNQGNKAALHSMYNEAADPGYLVLVFDWNTNYTGLLIEHIGAGGVYASYMQHDLEIIDSKRSTGTSALVF